MADPIMSICKRLEYNENGLMNDELAEWLDNNSNKKNSLISIKKKEAVLALEIKTFQLNL